MPTLLTCFRNRRVLTGRRRRSKVREWRDMHRKWQTQTGHFVRAFYTTQIFETFIFRFYRPFNDMTGSYSQNIHWPKIYWRIKIQFATDFSIFWRSFSGPSLSGPGRELPSQQNRSRWKDAEHFRFLTELTSGCVRLIQVCVPKWLWRRSLRGGHRRVCTNAV